MGSIVPIFKKGDNKNPNNYRGITILSCLGKLFTRLMNNRLSKWAESESRITNSQYGFRKGKSTTDCVFILKGLIDMILSQGNKLYAAFVDYEKAYDYLDRSAVFYKLTKNGVSSKFVNIFKSLYSKIKLNLRGYKSEEYFTSNCGLLQGESTSPLLFSFFVNDLENSLQQDDIGCSILDTCIKFLMFADDTVIISKTKDGLQAGLDSLERYCMKWGLRVNANKTKIVVFRKGGKLKSSEKWTYCGKFLEIVSSFKYLGCILSITGSFSKNMDGIAVSSRRAIFGLRKLFAKNSEILPSMQIDLFKKMVSPILSFGGEVWGLNAATQLETIHLSFLKSILGVKTSTPNCFIYGELGVYPLYIERQIMVIKYWLKLLSLKMDNDEVNYVVNVYEALYNLSLEKPNIVTWCTQVRDLLFRVG